MSWERSEKTCAQTHFEATTQGGLLAQCIDSDIVWRFLKNALRNKQARAKGQCYKVSWCSRRYYGWEIPLAPKNARATLDRVKAYVNSTGNVYRERLFIQSNGYWRYVLYGASGGELLVLGRNASGLYSSAVSCDANDLYDMLYQYTVQFMRDHKILLDAE